MKDKIYLFKWIDELFVEEIEEFYEVVDNLKRDVFGWDYFEKLWEGN